LLGMKKHTEKARNEQRQAERTALLVGGSNLLLVAVKYALARWSGSTALLADALHSSTDVVGSAGIYLGLLISRRKTRRFPYGLYKVENFAALMTSLLILLAGGEILREILSVTAVLRRARLGVTLAGVLGIILWTLLVSRYEERVGRRLRSPSLLADARHVLTDLFSTVVIFFGLVGGLLGWQLDRVAAVIVVLFIFKSGAEISLQAIRVLLDASLDYETLDRIRQVILSFPQVQAIHFLKGRNSGRFKFVEAEIEIREPRLLRAHEVTAKIEERIRNEIPGVDEVLLHYEPVRKKKFLFAVPVAEDERRLSPHFGEAPYFALITWEPGKRAVTQKSIVPNPFLDINRGRGIAVAEWLVARGADAVLTAKQFEHRGPAYVFRNADVAVYPLPGDTLSEVVQRILTGSYLPQPAAAGPEEL